MAGSDSGGGLSSSPAQAVESSVVAGALGQYVAWSDSRSGQYEIYVAEHTASGWQQLAGSAQDGGISDTAGAARRPSIALNASGEPIVAYTVFNGSTSDIDVAQYDPTANGGAGGWVALGGSLGAGGISGTGKADHADIVETAAGPVVAWLDSSSGAANVFAKQFVGGAWTAPGSGAATGAGVSGSATSVSGLALATDGTNVAVAWSQSIQSAPQQIYVLQYSAGVWNPLGNSASGNGISNSTGHAAAPSLAYFGGALRGLARQRQRHEPDRRGDVQRPAVDCRGNRCRERRRRFQQPRTGDAARALRQRRATVPRLDRQRVSQCPGQRRGRLRQSWSGTAFAEQVTATPVRRHRQGNSASCKRRRWPWTPAAIRSSPGRTSTGNSQIDLLGNQVTIGTTHYVNDGRRPTMSSPAPRATDGKPGCRPASPLASGRARSEPLQPCTRAT